MDFQEDTDFQEINVTRVALSLPKGSREETVQGVRSDR